MQNENDLKALSKILSFIRAVSVIILLTHMYFFCYSLFLKMGLTHFIIDKIIMNLYKQTSFFNHPLYSKAFVCLLLGLSLWGNKGVKNTKITLKKIIIVFSLGFIFFFFSSFILNHQKLLFQIIYIIVCFTGYILILISGAWVSRLLSDNLLDDVFNLENESFMQETRLVENQYSVNLPSLFYYKKKWHKGWINIINPFRATIVLGTPGSGKSYAVINRFIKQQIQKGFAMYIYDYKFNDLSTLAYNHLLAHSDKYKIQPKFYVINFDNPMFSHRSNPLDPKFLTDISDAYEAAYTIMLNLNRT